MNNLFKYVHTHFFQQFMEKMAFCEQFCCNSCFHGNIDESSALLVVLFYPGNSVIKLFLSGNCTDLQHLKTTKKKTKKKINSSIEKNQWIFFTSETWLCSVARSHWGRNDGQTHGGVSKGWCDSE